MSTLFERSVRGLLTIVLALLVSPWALAQDQEGSGGEAGDKANSSDGERQREMISTGLGSEAIAREWPDAAVWLELPEDGRVLALFEPEAGGRAKGALIVLADEGQSAASGLAGALRKPMAKAGWAILTIGLEPAPYAVQQTRRQQDASSEEPRGDNSDSTGEDSDSVMIDVINNVDVDELDDRYQARIQDTLTAAVGYLEERDYGPVALAGIGQGASHVTRLAVDGGEVAALVWIVPRFPRDQTKTLPEKIAEAGSLRVLELHSSRQSADGETRSPADRAAAFKRSGIDRYSRQPVAMPERPEARDAPALANRLSAWLEAER